jgi:hypothetical protein
MATLVLPCKPGENHYTFGVELDANTYQLEFRWNVRDASWYFSIYDAAGAPIAIGARVVIGFPLHFRNVSERMPPGIFDAVDTSGKGSPPGLLDLGGRVQLLYTEAVPP